MKLKQSTLLAIIGVILNLISSIIWFLITIGISKYSNWAIYLNFIYIIGFALILPFFVILYKSQK